MNALDLVALPDFMKRGQGRAEITIALIDGPVARDLPDLAAATIREIPGKLKGTCTRGHRGVHPWHPRGPDFDGPAGLCRSVDLSRMPTAASPHFCGSREQQRTHAKGDSRRACGKRSSTASRQEQ